VDDRWTLWPVQDHQLQEISCSIRSGHQVADRIVGDLFDDHSVLPSMLDVVVLDIVTKRRRENLYEGSVLRNLIDSPSAS